MKKIPDNATLVFKGVLHDTYQWEQQMFDGTTALFEAIKRRDAVNVIAVSDNKILINEEEQPGLEPFISLPGGNSETGTFLEGAKRELLEETGYSSNEWIEWMTIDILKYHKLEWNNHVFIAKNAVKTNEQQLDAGEKIQTRLIPFEEFLELRNNPKFRQKDVSIQLEKIAHNETEKQALKDLLGITT